MDNTLADYFRCADDIATGPPKGPQPADQGYFVFRDTICYGRCWGASPAREVTTDIPDVSPAGTCDGSRLDLPFVLSEVVRNLRQEHYARSSPHGLEGIASTSFLRHLYYLLRPLLSVAVRSHLQRIRLSGWERIAFPHWPVDCSVDALMKHALALVLKHRGVEKLPFIWFWPEGANGCVTLTHDVETAAGLAFCDELMDLDDAFGLKSSFQLIPEGHRYRAKNRIEDIRSKGFEVNIHDLNHDGHLFEDRPEFLRRVERINRYAREFGCRGFRAGAMYRNQSWFDKLALSYDMSVPNVAHLEPQRGGCCTVMPYFVGNVLELPLTTIQDYSLFHILNDYSTTIWKAQIELILEHHGVITVLTHPDYLIEMRPRAVYRELLGYLIALTTERSLWAALPGEIDRWWRNRKLMTLVPEGSGWRIEGPDAGRARVAYAKLDGEQLVYCRDKTAA
jgi:hypothetical protein